VPAALVRAMPRSLGKSPPASPARERERKRTEAPPSPPSKSAALRATKFALLAAVVVQNAALNVAARWSRVEAEREEARTGCASAPTTVVLTVELVKIVASLGLFAFEEGRTPWGAAGEIARVTRANAAECAKIAVPAGLYVLQNNLLLVAAANLEGPILALFGQLKILSAAVFSVVLLKRSLGARRWAALFALTVAIATVQLSQRTTSTAADAGSRNMALGLATEILVATVSGFAGVYFEMVLKGSQISVWVRNVHLAVIGSAVAAAAVYAKDYDRVVECGFYAGYGPVACLYVGVQAIGGLLIAAVVKYADNILKAFATSVSIVVVGLVSHVFFGFELSALYFLGALGVLYAIFLYGDLLKDLPPFATCPPWLGGPPPPDASVMPV